MGGVEAEIACCIVFAKYFCDKLVEYNQLFEALSNVVTPLHPTPQFAYETFLKIKNEYGMWWQHKSDYLSCRSYRLSTEAGL